MSPEAEVDERPPLLRLAGPLTVKEVEDLVFRAAREDARLEAAQRTWLEDDRSYFVRWRESNDADLRIVGLVRAFQLPEMASRVEAVPFDEEDAAGLAGLQAYLEKLSATLRGEGFA